MSHQVEVIISVVTPLFIAWPLATTRPNQVGLWLPPSHCSVPRLPNGHHGVFHMGFALGCRLCHLHKGLVSLGSRKPRKIDGVSGRIWISLFSNWKWKKHTHRKLPQKEIPNSGGQKINWDTSSWTNPGFTLTEPLSADTLFHGPCHALPSSKRSMTNATSLFCGDMPSKLQQIIAYLVIKHGNWKPFINGSW